MKTKLLIHILLYILGAAGFVLMIVLKSKALGIIGLILLFAAVLMSFLNAIRRIGEAKEERKSSSEK
jgi:hypothetical protein